VLRVAARVAGLAGLARGSRLDEVSTFARESEEEGTQSPASMPLRTSAVTPRPYRPSLRQDRTPAGYAVKALLARSVLAFGCAPHAACGVSMTAPAGERPCLRGDRYTVSLWGGPVLRWVFG